MMRVIVLGVLAASSMSLKAQSLPRLDDRVLVSVTADAIRAAYPDSVKERQGVPSAWILEDYVRPTKNGARSTKVLLGARCNTEELAVMSVTDFSGHNGEGRVISSSEANPADFSLVSPGSSGEELHTFICGMSQANEADRAAVIANAAAAYDADEVIRKLFAPKPKPKPKPKAQKK